MPGAGSEPTRGSGGIECGAVGATGSASSEDWDDSLNCGGRAGLGGVIDGGAVLVGGGSGRGRLGMGGSGTGGAGGGGSAGGCASITLGSTIEGGATLFDAGFGGMMLAAP